jgi:hypothetical protein
MFAARGHIWAPAPIILTLLSIRGTDAVVKF